MTSTEREYLQRLERRIHELERAVAFRAARSSSSHSSP